VAYNFTRKGVVEVAKADGVATASHDNLIQAVQDAMWQPVYPEVV